MSRTSKERRIHRRFDISCPLTVLDAGGTVLFKIRTTNVSDGGVYLETPSSNLPESGVPDTVSLTLSVPRSTRNSFMLEQFQSGAEIVRTEPLAGDNAAAIAMKFDQPLSLHLDV